MTTPNRQSLQVKNNIQTDDTKLAWYQSPIVWLGIILTVVIFLGCLHLLYIAAEIRSNEASRVSEPIQKTTMKKKELTHILVYLLAHPLFKKTLQTTIKNQQKIIQVTMMLHYEYCATLLSL